MLFLKFPLVVGIVGYFLSGLILLSINQIIWKYIIQKIWHQRHIDYIQSTLPSTQFDRVKSFYLRIEDYINTKFNKTIIEKLLSLWKDSGLGKNTISLTLYIGLILGIILVLESLLNLNLLLSILFGFILYSAFFFIIYKQAQKKRNRFIDQFPIILEQLSDSLTSGLSFLQAVEFVIPNLPQPSSSEMVTIYHQLILGFSVDEVLKDLFSRFPSENIKLLIVGIAVQQNAGGNIAEMMRDMAITARDRVNLRNEIKSLTAQGRLTAIVIVLLIPLSIGLLSFLPGYSEVLFATTAGNMILIIITFLELLGTIIVSRLVRPEP
jgi:tight adherence protein B